ncbi:hypothetical protein V6N13_096222 [Hibiscus sabdariffa]
MELGTNIPLTTTPDPIPSSNDDATIHDEEQSPPALSTQFSDNDDPIPPSNDDTTTHDEEQPPPALSTQPSDNVASATTIDQSSSNSILMQKLC